jgi:hypothetical protein
MYLHFVTQPAIATTERSFQNIACKKMAPLGGIFHNFRSGAEFNGEEKPGKKNFP